MTVRFLITLLLLPVFSFAQNLPNGIYIVADSIAKKEFPKAEFVTVKNAYDKPVALLNFPGPALGEAEISGILYHHNIYRTKKGNQTTYGFDFYKTEKGNLRCEELVEHHQPFSFAFVFNGKSVGEGLLFYLPYIGTLTGVPALCEYKLIRDSLEKWSCYCRRQDSLLRKTSKHGDYWYYRLDGKPLHQETFIRGKMQHERTWYANGNLKKSFDQVPGSTESYTRDYYPNGQVKYLWCYGSDPYYVTYAFAYSERGQLYHKDSLWEDHGQRYRTEIDYDPDGRMEHKTVTQFLPPFPGEEVSKDLNNPQLATEWNYKNGELESEGQFFAESDLSGGTPVGKWTRYEAGKEVETKTYPPWQQLYEETVAQIRARNAKQR